MSSQLSRHWTPSDTPEHLPGEAGVWIFILGDMFVFAMLFAVFLYYRGRDPALFAAGQATLHPNLGVLNTVLLLVSSLFVVIALNALKRNSVVVANRFVLAAGACGIGFVVVKSFEYSAMIDAGHSPGSDSFYMYYFILTGIHLGHLIVGLAVLAVLSRMLACGREWTPQRFAMFEGGACFWHMVDLLWIVLFPLIFLVR